MLVEWRAILIWWKRAPTEEIGELYKRASRQPRIGAFGQNSSSLVSDSKPCSVLPVPNIFAAAKARSIAGVGDAIQGTIQHSAAHNGLHGDEESVANEAETASSEPESHATRPSTVAALDASFREYSSRHRMMAVRSNDRQRAAAKASQSSERRFAPALFASLAQCGRRGA